MFERKALYIATRLSLKCKRKKWANAPCMHFSWFSFHLVVWIYQFVWVRPCGSGTSLTETIHFIGLMLDWVSEGLGSPWSVLSAQSFSFASKSLQRFKKDKLCLIIKHFPSDCSVLKVAGSNPGGPIFLSFEKVFLT